MARTVTTVSMTILPAHPRHDILHRVHEWLTEHASSSAAATREQAGTVHSACKLKRPARITRLKQALRRAISLHEEDMLHVEAAEDAAQACARVIDDAGGLAYAAAPSTGSAAAEPPPLTAMPAEAKWPHALLLHGLTVAEVLTGRHALWASQRAAGVLRPLPLSAALHAVAAHVDISCMLPVAHACESPDVLAERFQWPERLRGVARHDMQYVPKPTCVLCWRNEHVHKELGAGHVRAAIPALYAAGYDAGHLLLRHAEHGLARAVTDAVHDRQRRDGAAKRRRKHRREE